MNVTASSATKFAVTAGLNKTAQVAIVGLSIVAWFTISNHCALGGLVASAKMQSATEPMHCHGDQPSPPKKSGGREMPCCKILCATLSGEGKTVQNPSTNFLPIQSLAFVALVSADDARFHRRPLELDTGPPGWHSFAELVLQRSIVAHAPPFFLS